MKDSIQHVLADLKQVFAQLQTRWYVFGAQAVNVWGKPRTTADIDITIGTEVSLSRTFDLLGRSGFRSAFELDDDFLRHSSVLPVVHVESDIPVDIVVGRSGLEEAFLNRATRVPFGQTEVPVVSSEDLIVLKLIAGRPKDIEDASTVVAAQRGSLDIGYVRDLLGQVETALDQSDLVALFDQLCSD